MSEKRVVELDDKQIAFLLDQLPYAAKVIRDSAYPGMDPKWVAQHRAEHEQMITSLRQALRAAK
jgi:signal recognition particle subunit SEC65